MSNAPSSSKKRSANRRDSTRPRRPAGPARPDVGDSRWADAGDAATTASDRRRGSGNPVGSSKRQRKPVEYPDADRFPASSSHPGDSRASAFGRERARPADADGSFPRSPRPDDSAPRLTLPSIPAATSSHRTLTRPHGTPDTREHRTLLSGLRAQHAVSTPREAPGGRPDSDGAERHWHDAAPDDQLPLHDGLAGSWESSGRMRAARPWRQPPAVLSGEQRALTRVAIGDAVLAPSAFPRSDVPDLAAYRQTAPERRVRPHVDTRRLLRRARSPWNVARICLVLIATLVAILTTYTGTGESSQPLMFSSAVAGAGPVSGIPWPVNAITAKVQPETQLKRVDLYDSLSQFNQWGGAACSAAALSEVLTAYGVQGATIGGMIDELGPDISPNWGLLTFDGFSKVAAMHGLRGDVYTTQLLTYPQMQYLTNTLGIPVIVNVRISYGYYHFFSGGHFMVMTYGDSQGVRLVDSSLYYVQYLPIDVFRSMFTGRTAVIVPKDMQYTLPTA